MTLQDKIREHLSDDADLTAKLVITDPETRRNWEDWFLPLLRDECRRLMRIDARSIECGPGCAPIRRLSVPVATSVRKLLDQRLIYGSSGQEVTTWGKATVVQMRQRITMLEGYRATVKQDIDRIESAIEDIESAGVTCLDKIKGWVPRWWGQP